MEEESAPIVAPIVNAIREGATVVAHAAAGITRAAHQVGDAVHTLRPAEQDRFGSRSELRPPRALEMAFRFCRSVDSEGVWHGLAEHVRLVPEEHVARACTIGRGPECWVVKCPCGSTEFVGAALVVCRGGDDCRRWFAVDGLSVWCVRLPEGQDYSDAEAA